MLCVHTCIIHTYKQLFNYADDPFEITTGDLHGHLEDLLLIFYKVCTVDHQ